MLVPMWLLWTVVGVLNVSMLAAVINMIVNERALVRFAKDPNTKPPRISRKNLVNRHRLALAELNRVKDKHEILGKALENLDARRKAGRWIEIASGGND